MKEPYLPSPVDTSNIYLPEELNKLIEQMAKNVHEVWAKNRIEQGWTLVSYEELPDEEKKYDRDTAIETLKLICKLGFKIIKE